jgi:hypothetical protein
VLTQDINWLKEGESEDSHLLARSASTDSAVRKDNEVNTVGRIECSSVEIEHKEDTLKWVQGHGQRRERMVGGEEAVNRLGTSPRPPDGIGPMAHQVEACNKLVLSPNDLARF